MFMGKKRFPTSAKRVRLHVSLDPLQQDESGCCVPLLITQVYSIKPPLVQKNVAV